MANWAGGASGALGGAGSGAALGSVVPGVGTAIGAGAGGLLGLLAGLFGGGSKGKMKQGANNFNPQQQSALSMLLGNGMQQLQNPTQGFQPIADQARTQFNQQTLPSIAERFTSLGDNSLSSPAFHSELGQAGSGLEGLLAALQAQYGQQSQQNALGQLSLGLQPQFENYYRGSQPGFGENLLSNVFQAGPQLYQSYQLSNALKALKG